MLEYAVMYMLEYLYALACILPGKNQSMYIILIWLLKDYWYVVCVIKCKITKGHSFQFQVESKDCLIC